MMSKVCRLTLILLLLAVCTRAARAEDLPAPEAVAPAEEAAAATVPAADPYQKLFFQGLNLIAANQFAPGGEKFVALKELAALSGLENLPSFSVALMERAEGYVERGEKEKATFLIRHARLLSPSDPRISFGVAHYPEIVGYPAALSAAMEGLFGAPRSPIMLAALLSNALLAGLVGLTLSLAVVCVIQIARRRALVFACVHRALPVHSRGVLGPFVVLALLVLPVFGGILFALIAWSLLLARALRPAKSLAIVTGLTVLVWGLALPILAVSFENTGSKLAWTIEAIRARSYVPHAKELIAEARAANRDPILGFAYAQSLVNLGDLDGARAEYQKVIGSAPTAALDRAARFHLATLEYLEERYDSARAQFEKLEPELGNTFELVYNLSLVRLAQLDTEGQRKYYEAARSMDAVRLSRLEREAVAHPAPLLIGAPAMQYFHFVLRPHVLHGKPPTENIERVSNRLFIGASPTFLAVLGVCSLILAALSGGSIEPLGEEHTPAQNFLLRLVPGGMSFSGVHFGRGSAIFGVFLAFILAGVGTPVHFVPISPLGRSMGDMFFSCAAAMLVCTWIVSLLAAMRKKKS